eukprot:GILK01000167.1.p1 GENE.GILK01000167.1~~GILK01000167.1.p1  ORF type:complete len:256 (+),score=35.43 GILK01000167.1:62-829(+)
MFLRQLARAIQPATSRFVPAQVSLRSAFTPFVRSFSSEASKTVYVGGLSYDANESDINSLFSDVPGLTSVRLLRTPDTQRSKGTAFVEFDTPENAERAAQAKADTEHLGRTLKVALAQPKTFINRPARTPRFEQQGFGDRIRPEGCTTVYVGNLPYTTTEEVLRELFQDCGDINSIRIAMGPDGRPRGFAHVDFSSEDAVDKAMVKNSTDLSGRTLTINFAFKKSGEFRNERRSSRDFDSRRGGNGDNGGEQQSW